jgi:hypothetical protein
MDCLQASLIYDRLVYLYYCHSDCPMSRYMREEGFGLFFPGSIGEADSDRVIKRDGTV